MNWFTDKLLAHYLKLKGMNATVADVYKGECVIVLYPQHLANRMLFTSFLFLIDVSIAFILGYYDLMILGLLTTVASINHWRYPIFGIRRTIDLIMAQTAILYHAYCAYYESLSIYSMRIYFMLMASLLLFYLLAVFCAFILQNLNFASISHCMMHITGIIANAYLYFNIRKGWKTFDPF